MEFHVSWKTVSTTCYKNDNWERLGSRPPTLTKLEVLFSHIPGLKVVAPSNASDAKSLLMTSIKEKHPVIFFEHRWLHDIKGKIENKKEVKIGKAKNYKKRQRFNNCFIL